MVYFNLAGRYTYTFTDAGDFFYSAGNVLDSINFHMLGSVRVSQRTNMIAPVHVSVNGFDAMYIEPVGEQT